MRQVLALVLVPLAFVLGVARPASAQRTPGRISPFVLDIRAFSLGLGQDARTAGELGVTVNDLPGRGLGALGGIHLYPVRRERFALGLGGDLVLARGRKTAVDANGDPTGLVVEQRLFSLQPALSLNFGTRNGYSYVSAGMGPASFGTFTGTLPPTENPPRKMTINMGGGGRWFVKSHVAFSFDMRFLLLRPENTLPLYPGRDRQRMVILSAGISIR